MILTHSDTVTMTLDELLDAAKEGHFYRDMEERLNLPIPVDNLELQIKRCNLRENTITILISGTTDEQELNDAIDDEAVA